MGVAEFSTDFTDGLTLRDFVARVRCAGFYATSLSFRKEVAKKGNQGFPPWISLSVPHCIDKDEI